MSASASFLDAAASFIAVMLSAKRCRRLVAHLTCRAFRGEQARHDGLARNVSSSIILSSILIRCPETVAPDQILLPQPAPADDAATGGYGQPRQHHQPHHQIPCRAMPKQQGKVQRV